MFSRDRILTFLAIAAGALIALGLLGPFKDNGFRASCVERQNGQSQITFRNKCNEPIRAIVCESWTIGVLFRGGDTGRQVCHRRTIGAGSEISRMSAGRGLNAVVLPGRVDIYACRANLTPYLDRTDEKRWTCETNYAPDQ